MSLLISNLTKSYAGKIVVDHLSFKMDKPAFTRSRHERSGKTTSIRMYWACCPGTRASSLEGKAS
jgi:ABC-type uncharacterized transport system ATPase subunit